MTSILEKGGGTFKSITRLLCENPLPPVDEAIAATQAEVPRRNYYPEPGSETLRRYLGHGIGMPQRLVPVHPGSELFIPELR
jgi:histidinol-phosphate aminotransferase